MILLDTHVVVWLYAKGAAGVPVSVARELEADELGIAPIVNLELTYLKEIGRLTVPAEELVSTLAGRINLRVIDVSTTELVASAIPLNWTRDPFDRLICAHTLVLEGSLVTKDDVIRRNFDSAFWSTD